MKDRRGRALAAAVGLTLVFGAAGAHAWKIDLTAPASQLEDLHKVLSGAIYPYAGHGAAPLGLVGFEVWGDVSGNRDFDKQSFRSTAIDGSLSGGVLSVARVGIRKGLPGNVDLEASYGKVLETDLNLAAATVQWSLLPGGAVSPAFALRVTGSRTSGGTGYDLRQIGVEGVLSKGFAVATPYLGGGIVRSEGRFDRIGGRLDTSTTRPMVFAGVSLRLLIPRLNIEVQRAETLQATVRLGFGF